MPDAVHNPIDRRRAAAAVSVLVILLVAAAGAIGGIVWRSWGDPPARPRAAIIDQLALTDANPDFVASATRHLESAGYVVDYYPAEAVTVDFYRDLPRRGYSFIVLRSHTSDYRPELNQATRGVTDVPSTGLFTNETYSTQTHLQDQRAKRLMVDRYADREIAWQYFGITPDFIKFSTGGRFADTTIVLMGCAGLKTDDLAQAFIAKGAKELVSWDSAVTAQHTDAATENLLEHLLDQWLEPREAIASTMEEVGPDPAFGSRLLVYP